MNRATLWENLKNIREIFKVQFVILWILSVLKSGSEFHWITVDHQRVTSCQRVQVYGK